MSSKINTSEDNYSQYLRLFQMQLLGVLEDMETPAESLSSVFSEVLMELLDLKINVSKDEGFDNKQSSEALDGIIQQMQGCITGFQFFDSKRQRLENISDGLGDLSQFIADSKKDNNEINDKLLKSKIIGLYKMEREHGIYRKFLEENNILDEHDNAVNE